MSTAAISPARQTLRRMFQNPSVIVGGLLVLAVVLLALLAPALGTRDPSAISPKDRNQSPGYETTVRDRATGKKVTVDYKLGSDTLGRDVYSRIIYGARISLIVGLSVAVISIVIGVGVGVLAGYVRWLDGIIMRLMDGLMAIPAILLAIAVVSLFSAGGESTASLLGTAVGMLTGKPDVQRRLREHPELMGAFVEETLRLEPPFRAHYRHVLRDTRVAGVDLPADSMVLLLWGAANRDPAHVEAPDEFRLDRPTIKGHLTFGKGVHFCLGAPLARLEAMTVLPMLLERTTRLEAAEVGPWLPSVLARRYEYLELAVE